MRNHLRRWLARLAFIAPALAGIYAVVRINQDTWFKYGGNPPLSLEAVISLVVNLGLCLFAAITLIFLTGQYGHHIGHAVRWLWRAAEWRQRHPRDMS